MAQATNEFSVAKRWSIPQGGIEGSNTLRRPFLFFTLDKYVEHMSSWHRKKNPNSIGNVVGMGDESKSGYR